MNILVLGGTRYFGVHLVENLLREGHQVTIATRGLTPDSFGGQVGRIQLERTSQASLAQHLGGRRFDCVYDNLAYCSNDVKFLLEAVETEHYCMASSVSVYPRFRMNMPESGFDPLAHPLHWCGREEYAYDELKRQAECALFQNYPGLPSVAVRFPYVVGPDDYTRRLVFYVERIAGGRAMYIDNPDLPFSFVSSHEAGKILASLASNRVAGPLNACSTGSITLGEIIQYLEEKLEKKAILRPDGEPAPYNGTPAYSLDTARAAEWGIPLSALDSWLYILLDQLVEQVRNSNRPAPQ